MTINVKLKNDKFCKHSYIIAVFYKKGRLFLKGVSKKVEYALDKVENIEMYDYD